jgi:hypothetical protein
MTKPLKPPLQDRQTQLATALRENLKKRKAQARARATTEADAAASATATKRPNSRP